MQKLVFKNYIRTLILLLLGVTAALAVPLAYVGTVEIPLPIIILGMLTGFLLLCFVFYSKSTTGETLQIAITGILFNGAVLSGMYYANERLSLTKIILEPDFIVYINPAVLAVSFVFSFFAVLSIARLEFVEIKQKQEISEPAPEPLPEVKTEPELPPKPEPEPEPETTVKLEYKEIYEKKTEEEENYLPLDIRLIETSSIKETDQKGKIGSIGKLIVNDRNINDLTESEDILKHKANVISMLSGEEIYGKLDALKHDFTCIKEIALIDKGGFILASNFEDQQRAQIAGALISGAYHTIQNYLSQVSIDFPVRIFFETENTNGFIVKTKDEILFSIWDKEFKLVDYGPVLELVEPETSKKFNSVAAAIFDNIKVFLMNVQLAKLSKIVVFTLQKTVTIVKVEDEILAYITEANDLPKVSDDLLKMEEV